MWLIELLLLIVYANELIRLLLLIGKSYEACKANFTIDCQDIV